MRLVSLSTADPQPDAEDPPGFQAKMLRPGPSLGAKTTGASLYELPPGEAVCPYHYEYGEEEWVLVLEGRPSVRDPEGVHELSPLDLVFFPTGPEGAHQIRNDSDEPARVVMWSQNTLPGATVYPDSDKIGIWTGNEDDNILVKRESGVDYFLDEANDQR
jgi:uncharacterized cupin superfamily protein